MAREDQILNAIGRLYDTVLRSSQWPAALEAIGDVFDAGWVIKGRYNLKTAQPTSRWSVRVHPEFLRTAETHYSDPATNPLQRALGTVPVGGFLERQQSIGDAQVQKTAVYNDLLRPFDSYPLVAANLGVDGHEADLMVIGYHEFGRRLCSEEKKAFELLMPHLQRVRQVERRLTECNNMRAASTEALGHLTIGVIFVDRNARVQFVNRAATAILEGADGLTVTGRTLRAEHREQTKALGRLIEQAVQTTTGNGTGPGGGMGLSRPSGDRPLSVLVAPLPSEAAWGYTDSPAAVVFVSDPEQEEEMPEQLLMRLYGLTPTESAMASLLIQGQGLSYAADRLQISINTAKTHQKRIFSKTGTSRQAELVRLVLKGPAGLSQV